MARGSRKSRSSRTAPDGGVVVWKPRGPSSRSVVDRVQRKLGVRGLGHCGTLDPLASGVMVLTGGLGSKFQQWLTIHDKSYEATIWWGLGSDSGDGEGPLWSPSTPVSLPTAADVEAILPRFLGEQEQMPPLHSAVRIDGRRAYQSAREGKDVDLQARSIRIDTLQLLEMDGPRCRLRVDCGPGTYIRSLARDLGEAWGIPATLIGLRRLSCGVHTLEEAVCCDQICSDDWWPLEQLVKHLPRHDLSEDECRLLAQGQQLSGTVDGERVAWCQEVVQGIVEPGSDGISDGIKARRWLSRGVREAGVEQDPV